MCGSLWTRSVACPLLYACALFPQASALQLHNADAAASASLGTASALGETAAKARRFAVVNGWFNSPEAEANNSRVNKDILCAIALSLTTGSASVRTNLPDNLTNGVVIDKLLYTNLTSFGAASAQFMRSRGIRVMNIEHDPSMADVRDRLGMTRGWTKNMANVQKLSFLWATDYDGVLALDYDAFFTRGNGSDMLGALAGRKNGSMITFQTDGTLVAGGVVAVHPSQHYREEFEKAAKVISGAFGVPAWHGNYSKEAEDMMLEKYRGLCARHDAYNWSCCALNDTEPRRTMWCTAGGNADQGFMTHLAYDGQESRAEMRGVWGSQGCFQQPLDPKVWRADRTEELCRQGRAAGADAFWGQWDTDFGPQMKDDQECTAYFQTNHQMYLDYVARGGCA